MADILYDKFTLEERRMIINDIDKLIDRAKFYETFYDHPVLTSIKVNWSVERIELESLKNKLIGEYEYKEDSYSSGWYDRKET